MLTPFEGFVKVLSGTLSAMPMSSFLSSDMTTLVHNYWLLLTRSQIS